MLRALPAFACAALLLTACPSPPPDPRPPAGGPTASASPTAPAWKPKAFAKATEGCHQLWTCDCTGVAPRSGCHVEGTRDDSTTGVCAADSGPVNGCTRCMALPPPAPCACNDVCP